MVVRSGTSTQKYSARDGVVDSLQDVLYRDDVLNINSTMLVLAKLLTRFKYIYCDIFYLWYYFTYVLCMFSSVVGVLMNKY